MADRRSLRRLTSIAAAAAMLAACAEAPAAPTRTASVDGVEVVGLDAWVSGESIVEIDVPATTAGGTTSATVELVVLVNGCIVLSCTTAGAPDVPIEVPAGTALRLCTDPSATALDTCGQQATFTTSERTVIPTGPVEQACRISIVGSSDCVRSSPVQIVADVAGNLAMTDLRTLTLTLPDGRNAVAEIVEGSIVTGTVGQDAARAVLDAAMDDILARAGVTVPADARLWAGYDGDVTINRVAGSTDVVRASYVGDVSVYDMDANPALVRGRVRRQLQLKLGGAVSIDTSSILYTPVPAKTNADGHIYVVSPIVDGTASVRVVTPVGS